MVIAQGVVSEGVARARARDRARRHSALVRVLRRAIPLGAGSAALLIFGAAWLDPFGRLAEAGITLGPISVSGSKVSMQNPRLTGFRKENRPYEVTASLAFQDVRKPTIVELQKMRGRLALDEAGGQAHLEAASGVFDTTKELLELRDEIRLWTQNGQEVRLKSVAVDFKGGTARSRDPVHVTFQNGTLEAASLDVGDNGRVMSFVGRVRATFDRNPALEGETAPERIRTSAAADPAEPRE